MRVRKYWREIYYAAMMMVSYSIIIASMLTLRELQGVVTTAVGVFVAVLATGAYDKWYEEPVKVKIKNRR